MSTIRGGVELAGDLEDRAERLAERANRIVDNTHYGGDPAYLVWDEVDALRAGAAALRRESETDGAMHSVWLHGNWRWLTQQMTTAQREAAADAVMRYSTLLEPDDPVDPDRWWRS